MATQPDVPRRPPFPGFGHALLLVVLIWLAIVAVAVAVLVPHALFFRDREPPSEAVLLILANTVSFFGVAWFGWLQTGERAATVFPLRPVAGRLLVPVLLVTLGGVLVLAQVDSAFRLIPAPGWWHDFLRLVDETLVEMILGSLWASAIALVVVAPLTEEVFFRGLVLRGFVRRYSRGKAIVLSSLLFAITHLTPNQFLSAFVIGCFLAWIVLETGSLWLALFVHVIVNGGAVLGVAIMAARAPEALEQTGLLPWWTTALGVLLLAVGWRWLRRGLGARAQTAVLPQP